MLHVGLLLGLAQIALSIQQRDAPQAGAMVIPTEAIIVHSVQPVMMTVEESETESLDSSCAYMKLALWRRSGFRFGKQDRSNASCLHQYLECEEAPTKKKHGFKRNELEMIFELPTPLNGIEGDTKVDGRGLDIVIHVPRCGHEKRIVHGWFSMLDEEKKEKKMFKFENIAAHTAPLTDPKIHIDRSCKLRVIGSIKHELINSLASLDPEIDTIISTAPSQYRVIVGCGIALAAAILLATISLIVFKPLDVIPDVKKWRVDLKNPQIREKLALDIKYLKSEQT